MARCINIYENFKKAKEEFKTRQKNNPSREEFYATTKYLLDSSRYVKDTAYLLYFKHMTREESKADFIKKLENLGHDWKSILDLVEKREETVAKEKNVAQEMIHQAWDYDNIAQATFCEARISKEECEVEEKILEMLKPLLRDLIKKSIEK